MWGSKCKIESELAANQGAVGCEDADMLSSVLSADGDSNVPSLFASSKDKSCEMLVKNWNLVMVSRQVSEFSSVIPTQQR